MNQAKQNVTRRIFLKHAVFVGTWATVVPGVRNARAQTVTPPVGANPFHNPTFEAFVDTIIPGRGSDPTGAPGALEAGTIDFIYNMEQRRLVPLSLATVQAIVCTALTTLSFARYAGRRFETLNLMQRTNIVRMLTWVPGSSLLLNLVRAPFYTGAVNRVGHDFVGYPQVQRGYADFSFDAELWRSDPRCQEGNLP